MNDLKTVRDALTSAIKRLETIKETFPAISVDSDIKIYRDAIPIIDRMIETPAQQTPASDGWMPIETAPPYTDILMMFMSEGKYQKCQVASYIVWKDERIYSDWKWAPLPTHWMPLTALKQSTAKDGV